MFKTECYGSFKQKVVAKFSGVVKALFRELVVSVSPEEITITGSDLTRTESSRWESCPGVEIIKAVDPLV